MSAEDHHGFNLGEQYGFMKLLGKGAYGVVCMAKDLETDACVAVKKMKCFQGHPIAALRTLREIKLLKILKHENIIEMIDILKPASMETFDSIYMIQEYMESDLYRVLKTQKLTDDHCQFLIYQLIKGVNYIHSRNIIHRDLKPSNILVNSNCLLKICDFGLSRLDCDNDELKAGFFTEYVATRWYRAPEIMLSFKQYSKSVDIWAIGCILAELITGRPLFPGSDYHSQMSLMLDLLGTPSEEDFNSIKSSRARDYLKTLEFRRKIPFSHIFPDANPLAIDFLEKTLTFNPDKRLTAAEALRHPYLESYYEESDEVVQDYINENEFYFDQAKSEFSMNDIKLMLFEEINKI